MRGSGAACGASAAGTSPAAARSRRAARPPRSVDLALHVHAERRHGDVQTPGAGPLDDEAQGPEYPWRRPRRAPSCRARARSVAARSLSAAPRGATDSSRSSVRRRSAAPRSASSAAMRAIAAGAASTSAPRSNRVDASVLSPSRLLVRRTDAGVKYALSSTITRVVAPISDSAPPITPPTACARAASAITSMSGSSVRSIAVERSQASRLAWRAESAARGRRDARRVERMRRLAHLEHHVVGDVDDVADAADAGGLEPHRAASPATRPTATLEHLRAVARAEVRVLDADGRRPPASVPAVATGLPGGTRSGSCVGGRRLARQADHAQAVRTVGRDLEVDDRRRRRARSTRPRTRAGRASRRRLGGVFGHVARNREARGTTSLTAGTAPGSADRFRRTGGCRRRPT